MNIIHLIGGGDVGGAKIHVLSLIKEMNKYINVRLISLREGQFADDARKMGIDVEVVATGNFISDVAMVKKIAMEHNAKLIHSHGAKANLYATLSKGSLNIPVVTTMHSDYRLDYMNSFWKRVSYGFLNTIALRFVDYYVAVSNRFRKMLIDRDFNKDRIFTVYNGVDFNKELEHYSRADFAKKYSLDLPEDSVVIGILCRFDPVKGLDTYINAAKIVIDNNPNVRFILGGDGPQRPYLEKLVNSLGISGNVLFPGWIKNAYEFMDCIDINVLSSISESFPYVILEGVLYKNPTVSSDVGGISDLIDDGRNGFLFQPGDYKKLAEHLTSLINDPELRKAMGEGIYDKASKEFSLENMCKTQIHIYNEILGIGQGGKE
jgi:Glycosyltransferase